MAAGAAETVVKIEMPEGGIEVVQPHQADHPASQPDAFGVAGRAVDGLLGLDEFGRLALAIPDGIGGLCVGVGFALLILGGRGAALGEGAGRSDEQGQYGRGKVTQDHTVRLEYPATHTFPDQLKLPRQDPGARACCRPIEPPIRRKRRRIP